MEDSASKIRLIFGRQLTAYFLLEHLIPSSEFVREAFGGKNVFLIYFELSNRLFCLLLCCSPINDEVELPEWLQFLTETDGWLPQKHEIISTKFFSFLNSLDFYRLREVNGKQIIRLDGCF